MPPPAADRHEPSRTQPTSETALAPPWSIALATKPFLHLRPSPAIKRGERILSSSSPPQAAPSHPWGLAAAVLASTGGPSQEDSPIPFRNDTTPSPPTRPVPPHRRRLVAAQSLRGAPRRSPVSPRGGSAPQTDNKPTNCNHPRICARISNDQCVPFNSFPLVLTSFLGMWGVKKHGNTVKMYSRFPLWGCLSNIAPPPKSKNLNRPMTDT